MKIKELDDLYNLCKGNLVKFFYAFLPHYATYEPSPLHYELSDVLIASEDSVILALPREYGKTTYVWSAFLGWNVMFRRYRYVVLITDSLEKGRKQLRNAKEEIKGHPVLMQFIKKVIRDTREQFEWISADGRKMTVEVYGYGQSLRGLRYMETRPELIVLDDIETRDSVKSKTRRDDMYQWFNNDVLPLNTERGRIVYIGTMLHNDSVLARLIDNPPTHPKRFKVMVYGVIDEKGNPTWEARYPLAWIEEKRKDYLRRGMLESFYNEYMNQAIGKETRIFDTDYIVYYSPKQLEAVRSEMDVIIAVDLGHKVKETSDYTCIGAMGLDREGNYWVLDIDRFRGKPDEIIDRIYKMHDKWLPRAVYVEDVGGQSYLIDWIESGYGGKYIPIERIPSEYTRMNKEVRIERMQPAFKRRKVLFPANKHWVDVAIDELITFPKGKHDDTLDAMAYAMLLLKNPITHSSNNPDDYIPEKDSGTF